ncbi:hypothetical protein ASE04_22140 [Rhizobium sp. Root708]|uniref:hypothetical protein n=1 Tax=Rhizobium sp. Root708 TaxID=1736592 RepID=UPI0006FFE5D3|nr:hypothetical protein [Rhizobium sp. Root708]KRB61554.1 hypothetical protein ASE04_22140 [Rhizobium sp. Root708]
MDEIEKQVVELTGPFVERMRQDLFRPFEIRDFRMYVVLKLGWEAADWGMEVDAALLERFNANYDLVRAPLGQGWEFIWEDEPPE